MKILDLFSGAGGAAEGLHRYFPEAEIVGVDIAPQKHYPFTFDQADAMTYPLDGFDLIWASPPCQHYAPVTRWRGSAEDHPDYVAEVIQRLGQQPTPWIIENVPQAPISASVILCGSMFQLAVRRHRAFATSWSRLLLTPACDHSRLLPFCHKGERAYADAMGCTWMTNREAREAIPPCYSEYLAQFVPLEAL